jgi:hypothetical protein
MGVIKSASRLFDLLSSQDTTFTKYLGKGLSKETINSIIMPTGIVLPYEIFEFYSTFSLPSGYQYQPDSPTFFGIFWMLGLADAVKEYISRRKSEYIKENEIGWFPILQEDPNFYYFDTEKTNGNVCPIIGGSEYIEPAPVFISLQAMFDTMYEWVSEGVLRIENGHIEGEYKGDLKKVANIAARNNPGIERWRGK